MGTEKRQHIPGNELERIAILMGKAMWDERESLIKEKAGVSAKLPTSLLEQMHAAVQSVRTIDASQYDIRTCSGTAVLSKQKPLIFFIDIGSWCADGFKKAMMLLWECNDRAIKQAVIITDDLSKEKAELLDQLGAEISSKCGLMVIQLANGQPVSVEVPGIMEDAEGILYDDPVLARLPDINSVSFKAIAVAASHYVSGASRKRRAPVQPHVNNRISNRIAIKAGLPLNALSIEKSSLEYGPGCVAMYFCRSTESLVRTIMMVREDASGRLKYATKGIIVISSCWDKLQFFDYYFSRDLASIGKRYRLEFWLCPERGKATRLFLTRNEIKNQIRAN